MGKITSGNRLLSCKVIVLGVLLSACDNRAEIIYHESVLLSGTIGDDVGELGYRELDGEANFTSTFDIATDGTIWIDDPAHKAIRHYSPSGKYIGAIDTGDRIVDDISVVDSTRLAVCYWNRAFIDIMDWSGYVIDSCPLPSKSARMMDLRTRDETVYVSFNLYMRDSTWNQNGDDRDIGLSFSTKGTLLEMRRDSLAFWVETCGAYHTASADPYSYPTLVDIFNKSGQSFIKEVSDTTARFEPLGTNGEDYLFVVESVRVSERKSRYLVFKFAPSGEKRAEFEIPFFDRSMVHWNKLDTKGNVYVFDWQAEGKKWSILKYSTSD